MRKMLSLALALALCAALLPATARAASNVDMAEIAEGLGAATEKPEIETPSSVRDGLISPSTAMLTYDKEHYFLSGYESNYSSKTWDYDDLGHIYKVTSNSGASSGGRTSTIITLAYDENGRLISVSDKASFSPVAEKETFKYKLNNSGRITNITIHHTGYSAASDTEYTYKYDNAGNVIEVIADLEAMWLCYTYSYDNGNRLVKRVYESYIKDGYGRDGTTPYSHITTYSYRYNDMGQMINYSQAIDEKRNGEPGSSDGRTMHYEYQYDNWGQLIQTHITRSFGTDIIYSFSYDDGKLAKYAKICVDDNWERNYNYIFSGNGNLQEIQLGKTRYIFDENGNHVKTVSNGEVTDTYTYTRMTPAQEAAATRARHVIVPTRQNLAVDGVPQNAEIYNIDGANYFKLRDIAALLNGTGSQFSVDFDGATGVIAVRTGAAYTRMGGELTTGADKSASAVKSAQSLQIDGKAVGLTAYNIGGNNFFGLRDLGEALGFDVSYDTATATMAVTSR